MICGRLGDLRILKGRFVGYKGMNKKKRIEDRLPRFRTGLAWSTVNCKFLELTSRGMSTAVAGCRRVRGSFGNESPLLFPHKRGGEVLVRGGNGWVSEEDRPERKEWCS